MMMVYNLPFFSILAAILAAIITPLIGSGKAARTLHLLVSGAIAVCSALLAASFWGSGESVVYMMGHYPAPWGNELRFGLFEALMALLFAVVMFLSVLCGSKGVEEDVQSKKQYLYYVLLNLLLSSMLALIYTNDVFTAYVFIEINTLAACAIVMAKESGETISATIRYLVMSLLGSGLFLISVAILYAITGHLLMEPMRVSIAALVTSGQFALPLSLSALLMTLGLCVKSALFPFHAWLPDAHGSATTTSSAILSGLVVKGYIILLVKLFYRVFGIANMEALGLNTLLFALGLGGMIMGSVNAWREKDIKRMIAYSSVAQIGYIFMGLGLGTAAGLSAAFFHLIVHAVTKPMLFAAAGGLIDVSGHSKKIADLRGAGRRNPLAGTAFVVGALSMIGLPLFAGFPAKIFLSVAVMATPSKLVLAMLALAISTFLNAIYYLPVCMTIFAGEDRKSAKAGLRLSYTLPMVCYIAVNIVLGLWGQGVLQALTTSFSLL